MGRSGGIRGQVTFAGGFGRKGGHVTLSTEEKAYKECLPSLGLKVPGCSSCYVVRKGYSCASAPGTAVTRENSP